MRREEWKGFVFDMVMLFVCLSVCISSVRLVDAVHLHGVIYWVGTLLSYLCIYEIIDASLQLKSCVT